MKNTVLFSSEMFGQTQTAQVHCGRICQFAIKFTVASRCTKSGPNIHIFPIHKEAQLEAVSEAVTDHSCCTGIQPNPKNTLQQFAFSVTYLISLQCSLQIN